MNPGYLATSIRVSEHFYSTTYPSAISPMLLSLPSIAPWLLDGRGQCRSAQDHRAMADLRTYPHGRLVSSSEVCTQNKSPRVPLRLWRDAVVVAVYSPRCMLELHDVQRPRAVAVAAASAWHHGAVQSSGSHCIPKILSCSQTWIAKMECRRIPYMCGDVPW